MKDDEFFRLLEIIVSVKNNIMNPNPMASDQWHARAELLCLFDDLANYYYGSYKSVNQVVRSDIHRKLGFDPETGEDLEPNEQGVILK